MTNVPGLTELFVVWFVDKCGIVAMKVFTIEREPPA